MLKTNATYNWSGVSVSALSYTAVYNYTIGSTPLLHDGLPIAYLGINKNGASGHCLGWEYKENWQQRPALNIMYI